MNQEAEKVDLEKVETFKQWMKEAYKNSRDVGWT